MAYTESYECVTSKRTILRFSIAKHFSHITRSAQGMTSPKNLDIGLYTKFKDRKREQTLPLMYFRAISASGVVHLDCLFRNQTLSYVESCVPYGVHCMI